MRSGTNWSSVARPLSAATASVVLEAELRVEHVANLGTIELELVLVVAVNHHALDIRRLRPGLFHDLEQRVDRRVQAAAARVRLHPRARDAEFGTEAFNVASGVARPRT